MLKKARFRWPGKTECSVTEIVSENGRMRFRDILSITENLCVLLDGAASEDSAGGMEYIHPDNVLISAAGDVRLEARKLPLSSLEDYLPPELNRGDPVPPGARVYALGTLMLYMATGQEKKAETDVSVDNHILRSLIVSCTAFDPKHRFRDIQELLRAIRHETRAWKRALPVLILSLLVCLLAAALLFFWRSGKTRGGAVGEVAGYVAGLSRGFEQGFSDAPGIGLRSATLDARSGNLSGNYSAAGGAIAVCGEDAVFFFSGENLCRMDPYTKEFRVLAALPGAYDLQYHGGRLYCCTDERVLCLDPKTAKEEAICDSYGGRLYIFDDTFYLYDSAETGYLYRIDPARKTLTQLNGSMTYRCLNVVGGKLYYIDADRGNSICRSDPDGSNIQLISSSAYESLCVHESRLYAGTEDGLVRMDLNGGSLENLTTLPAAFPNASDGGIFYISGGSRALEWLSLDSRTRYTVVHAHVGSFNVAGQWIFYQNEDDGGNLWCVRISGKDNAVISQ